MSETSVFDGMKIARQIQERINAPDYRELRAEAICEARAAGWLFDEIAKALGLIRERVRAIYKQANGIPTT